MRKRCSHDRVFSFEREEALSKKGLGGTRQVGHSVVSLSRRVDIKVDTMILPILGLNPDFSPKKYLTKKSKKKKKINSFILYFQQTLVNE